MAFKDLLANLPDKPGVYQFFDKQGKIIYIGKALNLKKRVSSYFQKNPGNYKTRVMVKNIHDIRHIVVDNESDALLLENNLIKQYQPKYNVQLKDDKTFPWICIKNEPFPRVFFTRNKLNDGSFYLGPYTSVKTVKTLLDLVRKLYKLRTCKYNLSAENIHQGKCRVCLEYHIGNCKGPCENLQSEADYNQDIEQIKKILKGDIQQVIRYLQDMMKNLANNQQFEQAQEIKEKIALLQKYKSKSTIVHPNIADVDVFFLINEGDKAWVNFLRVIQGAVVQIHSVEIKKKIDEHDEQLLAYAVVHLRERFNSSAREIILPFMLEDKIPGAQITVPKRGDKFKLLTLSQRNLNYFILENQKRKYTRNPDERNHRLLEQLKNELNIHDQPAHIECFDNSNLQGSNPVAACVVFRNGKPARSEYRHFHVKTVSGPDDFASMEEVVYRRYKRLLDDNVDLPQLIVIDGGKGQLNAAVKSLEKLDIAGQVAIIGIAKRLEEIFKPGESLPLFLGKQAESLKVIQHIRNEAHRFGIEFHRHLRSNQFLESELDHIPGIGEKLKQKLLIKFGSIDLIKKAKLEDLQDVIGIKKGLVVWQFFNNNHC